MDKYYYPATSGSGNNIIHAAASFPSGLFTMMADLNESPPKSFVKVTGSASLEIEPDIIEFCIKITASKPELQDCRSSVKKREEYILAILKKHSMKDTNSQEMIHKEEIPQSQSDTSSQAQVQEHRMEFVLDKEISVKGDHISKYLNLVSVCNEKLDYRVEISQPIIKFSSIAMENATKSVLQMAVSNGKHKANNLIQDKKSPYNVSLGPVLYTTEDSFQMQDQTLNTSDSNFELLKWRKFDRVLNTQITTAYELITSKNKRYKTYV